MVMMLIVDDHPDCWPQIGLKLTEIVLFDGLPPSTSRQAGPPSAATGSPAIEAEKSWPPWMVVPGGEIVNA